MDQHRILIADDSRTILAMVSRTIEAAGYAVFTAADGVEAVQAIHAHAPELVLLDIHMPRLNGYQVCRLIKSDPDTATLPVVMLTASESRNDEFWSMQTGADHFLSKGGYKLNELLDTLAGLLPATVTVPVARPVPSAEDILSQLSALADRELHRTAVDQIRHRLVWEQVAEGLFVLDTNDCVREVNPAAQALLQLAVEDRPYAELLPPALCALVQPALADREPRAGQVALPGGSASARVVPLNDHVGEPAGALVMLTGVVA